MKIVNVQGVRIRPLNSRVAAEAYFADGAKCEENYANKKSYLIISISADTGDKFACMGRNLSRKARDGNK